MGEPRKVFRIEEIAVMRRQPLAEAVPAAPGYAEIMQELSALRALITPAAPSPAADMPQRAGIERLTSALNLLHAVLRGTQHERAGCNDQAPTTRITHELEAVRKGSEEATQKILAAAEEIDQAANNLSAALKDKIDRGLAQDIQDRVVHIFEACNFQDLISQRVAKVLATLKDIEAEIARARAEIARARTAPAMHGPRLESDHGHASQGDIDILFERA